MSRRRKLTELGKAVIEYFINRTQLSQQDIAQILEVDKSFVSRLRNNERELATHHMEALADYLEVPVGVMLIEACRPTRPVTPEIQKIMDLCEKAVLLSDKITEPSRMKRKFTKKAS